MLEAIIRDLDLPKAKMLAKQYNINFTDDELRYLLPILKQNAAIINDKQKRSALISTLPSSIQNKINQLLQRFSF